MDAAKAYKDSAVGQVHKNLAEATLSQHPMAFMVVFAVLILLVLVLAYFVYDYKKKADAASKSGYCNPIGVRSYNNLTMGGNYPQWAVGSESDQAPFTAPSSDEQIALTQMSVLLPWLRQGANESAHAHQCKLDRELENDLVGGCRSQWGSDATLQARALERLEAISYNDGYGEAKLDKVLDEGALSDEQLISGLHLGEVVQFKEDPDYIAKALRIKGNTNAQNWDYLRNNWSI